MQSSDTQRTVGLAVGGRGVKREDKNDVEYKSEKHYTMKV